MPGNQKDFEFIEVSLADFLLLFAAGFLFNQFQKVLGVLMRLNILIENKQRVFVVDVLQVELALVQKTEYLECQSSITVELYFYIFCHLSNVFVLHLQLQNPPSQDLHADQLPNVIGSQLHPLEVALQQLQDVEELPDVYICVVVEDCSEVTFEEFGSMRQRCLDQWSDVIQANRVFGINCHYLSDYVCNDAFVQFQRGFFQPGLEDGLQKEASLGGGGQLAEQSHRFLVVGQLSKQLDGLLLKIRKAGEHFAQVIDGIQVAGEDVLEGFEDEYLSDDVGLDLDRLAFAMLLVI